MERKLNVLDCRHKGCCDMGGYLGVGVVIPKIRTDTPVRWAWCTTLKELNGSKRPHTSVRKTPDCGGQETTSSRCTMAKGLT